MPDVSRRQSAGDAERIGFMENGSTTRSRETGPTDRIISLLNRAAGWANASRGRRVAIRVGLAVVAGAAVIALRFGPDVVALSAWLADGWRNGFGSPPAQEETQTAEIPVHHRDDLAGLPSELIAELTDPETHATVDFARTFRIGGKSLCALLPKAGLTGAHMMANPFDSGSWTCDSDVVAFGKAADDGEASSLFASLRGVTGDKIDFIRLKLNLVDPATAVAARQGFVKALATIGDRLGWPTPPPVLDAIDAMANLRLQSFGTDYEVHREWGDPPRINVVIRLARANDGILPADAFARPRRSSSTNARSGALPDASQPGPLDTTDEATEPAETIGPDAPIDMGQP